MNVLKLLCLPRASQARCGLDCLFFWIGSHKPIGLKNKQTKKEKKPKISASDIVFYRIEQGCCLTNISGAQKGKSQKVRSPTGNGLGAAAKI